MRAEYRPSLADRSLVTAEVEPVLEDRLRFEAELPEERRHVTVVAALVEEKMGDELVRGCTGYGRRRRQPRVVRGGRLRSMHRDGIGGRRVSGAGGCRSGARS